MTSIYFVVSDLGDHAFLPAAYALTRGLPEQSSYPSIKAICKLSGEVEAIITQRPDTPKVFCFGLAEDSDEKRVCKVRKQLAEIHGVRLVEAHR